MKVLELYFPGHRQNSTFHDLPAMSRSKTNDQVQHGQWRKDADGANLDVTLKCVDFADSEAEAETNRTKLLQEVAIMRQFRHPNILRLYGVVNEDRVSKTPSYNKEMFRVFTIIWGAFITELSLCMPCVRMFKISFPHLSLFVQHTVLVSEYFPRSDLRKILVQMGRRYGKRNKLELQYD